MGAQAFPASAIIATGFDGSSTKSLRANGSWQDVPSGGGGVVGEIDVASQATGGSGTLADPWTGWDTAITWAAFTRYRFRAGYFAVETSPNYLHPGIELIGDPGAYIYHTGTGDAFVMDAGPTPGSLWVMGVRVENLRIFGKTTLLTGTLSLASGSNTITGSGTVFQSQVAVGDSITFAFGTATARSYIVTAIASNTSLTVDRNAAESNVALTAKVCKTKNGIYLRGIRFSAFDRLVVKDVSLSGIYTEACVTNSLRLFRCSHHEPTQFSQFQCRPQYGITTSGRGGDWSTTWNIEEAVIEGTQIYGIWLKADSYGSTIINGASEGNRGIGIQIDGSHNSIIGLDVEQNVGQACFVNGQRNNFYNFFCFGNITFTSGGSHSLVSGGYFENFTINTSAFKIAILNATINGAYTDNGSSTLHFAVSGSNLRAKVGIPASISSEIPGSSGQTTTNVNHTNRIQIALGAVDYTINAPTNARNGDVITYVFNNNSGALRNITWNAVFRSLPGATLPTTCAHGTALYVALHYNSFWAKWDCVAVSGG